MYKTKDYRLGYLLLSAMLTKALRPTTFPILSNPTEETRLQQQANGRRQQHAKEGNEGWRNGEGWLARHGTSIRWARLIARTFGHGHRAVCSDADGGGASSALHHQEDERASSPGHLSMGTEQCAGVFSSVVSLMRAREGAC